MTTKHSTGDNEDVFENGVLKDKATYTVPMFLRDERTDTFDAAPHKPGYRFARPANDYEAGAQVAREHNRDQAYADAEFADQNAWRADAEAPDPTAMHPSYVGFGSEGQGATYLKQAELAPKCSDCGGATTTPGGDTCKLCGGSGYAATKSQSKVRQPNPKDEMPAHIMQITDERERAYAIYDWETANRLR